MKTRAEQVSSIRKMLFRFTQESDANNLKFRKEPGSNTEKEKNSLKESLLDDVPNESPAQVPPKSLVLKKPQAVKI